MCGLKGPASISHLHPSSSTYIRTIITTSRIWSANSRRFSANLLWTEYLNLDISISQCVASRGLPALVINTLHHPLICTLQYQQYHFAQANLLLTEQLNSYISISQCVALEGPASISHLRPSSSTYIHYNYHFAHNSLQINGGFKQTCF
jgi:hypothetical protein